MNDYLVSIFREKRQHGLLIDTNLLLLLFIGSYEPSWINKFKRTRHFNEEDFILLVQIAEQFDRLITTPNILTEVSNLSNQLPNNIKHDYYTVFEQNLEVFQEEYIKSVEVVKQDSFQKFGLTDSAIMAVAQQGSIVLTTDFPLANYLETHGLSDVNFNHLRGTVWFG